MEYNSKYKRMTTDELTLLERDISLKANKKAKERIALSREIQLLRLKAQRIRQVLSQRKKSQYNGEYFIKSNFRQKYGKPYIEFTAEERKEYQDNYYKEHKEEISKRRKRVRNEQNTGKIDIY